MKLKTQKQVAIGVLAAAGVIGTGVGVTKIFSHSSKPAPITATAPAALPTVTPPVALAPKAGDNTDQKAQKLSMLEHADQLLLQGRGYNVRERLMPFGRFCNNDGTTDGTGYHGTATGISYSVNKDGQSGKICVAHSGKDGVNATLSSFSGAAGTYAAPTAQTTTTPPQASSILSAMDGEKKQKLLVMQRADLSILRGQGFKVLDFKGQLGRACNNDGTTDGTGFKGTASSISYLVSRDGQTGQICMTHSGKIDTLKAQVGSPFVPQ